MEEHSQPSVTEFSAEPLSFWDKHRLSLLLLTTVIIALIMTSISVIIYNSTGAAQLDLSRPGYRSVSNKVDATDEIDTYSAVGAVNKDTIEEFMKLYDAQATKAKAVDAFNGDPLNPETLEFGTPMNQ
ncbi:MAG: hypothetical protein ACOH18_00470 [Candidatus Saccharimonadaceae bacterium]